MQQPTPSAAPVPGFAGLLASLTVTEQPPELAWSGDGLEDDVANVSYEGALKSQRLDSWDGEGLAPERIAAGAKTGTGAAMGVGERFPAETADFGFDARSAGAPCRLTITEAELPRVRPNFGSGKQKRVRVTIRLTDTEYAQIRARCDEAGLSVSAYLRTCIEEIDGLRAQVKDTLAQLRGASANTAEPAGCVAIPPASVPAQADSSRWQLRFWQRKRMGPAAA
jgi:hypothetical protein